MKNKLPLLFIFLLCFSIPADAKKRARAKKIEVDNLREKVWAKGESSQMGVIQNKYIKKQNRIQLSLEGGANFIDPFFNVISYGGTVGFNFTEELSLHAIAFLHNTNDSEIQEALLSVFHERVPVNRLYSQFSLEGRFTPIYGKVSFFRLTNIYYDLSVGIGAGELNTELGWIFSPHAYIGQHLYFTKWLSFAASFRLSRYEQQLTGSAKEAVWSKFVTAGLSFIF